MKKYIIWTMLVLMLTSTSFASTVDKNPVIKDVRGTITAGQTSVDLLVTGENLRFIDRSDVNLVEDRVNGSTVGKGTLKYDSEYERYFISMDIISGKKLYNKVHYKIEFNNNNYIENSDELSILRDDEFYIINYSKEMIKDSSKDPQYINIHLIGEMFKDIDKISLYNKEEKINEWVYTQIKESEEVIVHVNEGFDQLIIKMDKQQLKLGDYKVIIEVDGKTTTLGDIGINQVLKMSTKEYISGSEIRNLELKLYGVTYIGSYSFAIYENYGGSVSSINIMKDYTVNDYYYDKENRCFVFDVAIAMKESYNDGKGLKKERAYALELKRGVLKNRSIIKTTDMIYGELKTHKLETNFVRGLIPFNLEIDNKELVEEVQIVTDKDRTETVATGILKYNTILDSYVVEYYVGRNMKVSLGKSYLLVIDNEAIRPKTNNSYRLIGD